MLTLASENESGELEVRCAIPDVHLELDGRSAGRLPSAPLRVTPGSHRVVLRRAGYRSDTRDVVIAAGRTERVDCRLETDPAHPELADLRVPRRDGLVVAIDGVPFHEQRLPPGPHQLSAAARGYQPVERAIELAPRTVTRVPLTLTPTAESLLRERAQRGGTQRRVAYMLAGLGFASGTTAVILQIANEARWDDWRADSREFVADYANNPSVATPRRLDALIDQENSLRNRDAIALGLGVLGGALVAAASALYFTAEDAPPPLTLTPAGARSVGLGATW